MSNLVPWQPRSLAIPDASTVAGMLEMAKVLVASNMLPTHIKTPQAAFYAMQKGAELGIPPTHALTNIIVINGKPTCNAQLMAALIYRDHGGSALEYVESTPERCTIRYQRRDGRTGEYSYTIEDSRRAGLATDPWKKYPQAMLRARCISAVAVMVFPDSIAGMYTPEEMGANVTVDREGEVIISEVAEPPARTLGTPAHEQVYRAVDKHRDWIDAQSRRIYGRLPVDLTKEEITEFIAQLRAAHNAHAHVVASEQAAKSERAWIVNLSAPRGDHFRCNLVTGDGICGELLTDGRTQNRASKLHKLEEKGLPPGGCLCDGCLKQWATVGFPRFEIVNFPLPGEVDAPISLFEDEESVEFEAEEATPVLA